MEVLIVAIFGTSIGASVGFVFGFGLGSEWLGRTGRTPRPIAEHLHRITEVNLQADQASRQMHDLTMAAFEAMAAEAQRQQPKE